MRRLRLATAFLLTAAQSWAEGMTPSAAFEAGKAFGLSPRGAQAVIEVVTGASAAGAVPYYGTSHAHSIHYGGGVGDLLTPGRARVSECSTVVYKDAKKQSECDAINDLAKNRLSRPPLVIAPNDPILVKGAAVKANPAAIAKAFGGAYGECKSTTVTKPAAYETEVCNEFRTLEENVCHKTLTVKVTETTSCSPGAVMASYWGGFYCSRQNGPDWWGGPGVLRVRCDPYDQTRLYIAALTEVLEGSYGASGCKPHKPPNPDLLPYSPVNAYRDDWQLVADGGHKLYIRGGCPPGQIDCVLDVLSTTSDVVNLHTCPSGQITHEEALNNYGCAVDKGGCYTASDMWSCSTYSYAGPGSLTPMLCDFYWDEYSSGMTCRPIVPTATLRFQRPRVLYTTTDSWSDGCATLEARTK